MRIRSFFGCWACCAIVAGMSLDVLAQDCSEGRYAFMEAADESKRQGGAEVKLADVIAKARAEAWGKGK